MVPSYRSHLSISVVTSPPSSDFAMSSDADSDFVATVALLDYFYGGNHCAVAASVLVIYEGVVTLDREAMCFWAAGPTGASFLFTANKWISMVFYIISLVRFAPFPSDLVSTCLRPYHGHTDRNQSCSLMIKVTAVMEALQYVPGAVLSALCSYVLSRRKRYGLLVFLLSMSPVGANLVVYGYNLSGIIVLPFGCLQTDKVTEQLSLKFASQL
ncbi:hypothetical protein OH76DRAFT_321448 [Lentinus brumalis]|uniref:DUF6533 domain-containing protein n=1 Tax=Lentinus brumalis TaxID=2498619 RepID=A0A371DFJ9_9APHY|nr:hypothetical protein OH76DRAFT_321448 [Polyporus brumalis]